MKTQSTPPLAAVDQPRLVRGFGITDRFTGHKPSGKFGLGDDMDEDCDCPVCGAEIGQQCSEEDPDNKGMGIELGRFVHIERISSANAGHLAATNDLWNAAERICANCDNWSADRMRCDHAPNEACPPECTCDLFTHNGEVCCGRPRPLAEPNCLGAL